MKKGKIIEANLTLKEIDSKKIRISKIKDNVIVIL